MLSKLELEVVSEDLVAVETVLVESVSDDRAEEDDVSELSREDDVPVLIVGKAAEVVSTSASEARAAEKSNTVRHSALSINLFVILIWVIMYYFILIQQQSL